MEDFTCPGLLAGDEDPAARWELVYERLLAETGAGLLDEADLQALLEPGGLFRIPERGAPEREPLREGIAHLEIAMLDAGVLTPAVMERLKAKVVNRREAVAAAGERAGATRARMATSQLSKVLGTIGGYGAALAFSPDGAFLAAATEGGELVSIDVKSGSKQLFKIPNDVTGLWMESGLKAVVGSRTNVTTAGRRYRHHYLPDPGMPIDHQAVNTTTISPDGRWVAFGTNRAGIWVGDRKKEFPPVHLSNSDGRGWKITDPAGDKAKAFRHAVSTLQFSPASDRLAVRCSDGSQVVIKLETSPSIRPLSTTTLEHFGGSRSAAVFSPDGTRISSQRGTWDTNTGEKLTDTQSIELGGRPGAALHPTGKYVVFAGLIGLSIRDGRTGALLGFLELTSAYEGNLDTHRTIAAFSPDGKTLAIVGRDGNVRLWSFEALLTEAAP